MNLDASQEYNYIRIKNVNLAGPAHLMDAWTTYTSTA
jgi:hypothetical protein